MDPDRDGDLQPSRRRLDRLQVAGLEVDRILDQAAVDLTGQAVVGARAKPPQPLRITWHPRLRKRDEARPGGRGPLDQLHAPRERLLAVQGHWWMLDDCDLVRARSLRHPP